MTTLQRYFNTTDRRLRIRTPIVATPGLLELGLALGFHLDHRNDLVAGLHQFGLFQHTSDTWKVMKARSDQNQVIAGGVATTFLSNAAATTAPEGISLLSTLVMALGDHTQPRVFLVTLFGTDHPTMLAMKEVNT